MWRAGKVRSQEPTAATTNRTAYQLSGVPELTVPSPVGPPVPPGSRAARRGFAEGGIGREGGAQLPHLVPDRLQGPLVVPMAQGSADELADGHHLVGAHARRGLGGRAEPEPRGDERRAGIV